MVTKDPTAGLPEDEIFQDELLKTLEGKGISRTQVLACYQKQGDTQLAKIDQQLFEMVIDRILSGWSASAIYKWLRNTYAVEVHPNAIAAYVVNFIPEEYIIQSASLLDQDVTYENDDMKILNELVAVQKAVVKKWMDVKTKYGKSRYALESQRLFKMMTQLVRLKQSLGEAPTAPMRVEHAFAKEAVSAPDSRKAGEIMRKFNDPIATVAESELAISEFKNHFNPSKEPESVEQNPLSQDKK